MSNSAPREAGLARDLIGVDVLHYAAFTDRPDGGNPAGVVLDATGLSPERMRAIAGALGYSESVFLIPRRSELTTARAYDVRYFSPLTEVAFCGHATIAAAVALANRDGPGALSFQTAAGEVPVDTRIGDTEAVVATLTSVEPSIAFISDADLAVALSALHWDRSDLDPLLPPRVAYAGARHLILAAATRMRLSQLDYAFDELKLFMEERSLTTIDLVWRESARLFHARNPFPVGGIIEDPATGAAAAAFGAYLRSVGLASPPVRIRILQGEDMGRPSELLVDIDPDRSEIRVTGAAVRMTRNAPSI